MIINTDTYKCKRCSKKNWEPGTLNDYMIAINGITKTLYNMREVMWQLKLFQGCSFYHQNGVKTTQKKILAYLTDILSF